MNRTRAFFVAFLGMCLHSLLCLEAASPLTRQVNTMGTVFTVVVEALDREAAGRTSEAAVRAVEAANARLSTWRPESELSRLNHMAVGDTFALSSRLCGELEAALSWAKLTHGAFDPTVGALVRAYDLRGAGRWPSPGELEKALSQTSWRLLEVQGCVARKRGPVILEEGGFGKGAALDAALLAVKNQGKRVILDLGGQLAFTGPEQEVGLTHPQDRQRVVAWWRVKPGSVATSSNAVRKRWVEGRPLPHLLDPRTGLPASDFGSVAVWAPSALVADCLSTALFVMGPEAGLTWLARFPELAAVFLKLTPQGVEVQASPGARHALRLVDPQTFWHESSAPTALKKGE